MQQSENEPAPLAEGAEGLSLAEDLRQLAEEAKALAQAELAFQKSRAAYAGSETKAIAGLLVVAAVVVFFAVVAFVTGTVIALGPVLGLWGAMAAVTFGLLLAAGICALTARSKLKRMMAVISDEKDA
ncbi:phage holin family protein [Novosphingobium mangrovi (ex Huang et al. 2023)]|uniref:Phage holin family protein n=1 Tax=Novosphingobium mangrovi (ex Huang et al. 2023) TaxID=2976432 RepID=A0ABT2I7N8_9SPHN|nr:phage holin family protein [Novosphingobium mangrovi (ex Huang et al. 2023)]MCT2400822.1 phage holin family protein [Novosphingobium mangrovi (ex Huang et al. 2023)]